MDEKEKDWPFVRPMGKAEFLYILRGKVEDCNEIRPTREQAEARFGALYRGAYEAGRQSVTNCLSVN